jgi:Fe2+ transport system protein FeoA
MHKGRNWQSSDQVPVRKRDRLTKFKSGDRVKIVEIDTGRGAQLNLVHLGLDVGNIVEIARSTSLGGPVIVRFRDTEIAIGHRLAKKILAEEV